MKLDKRTRNIVIVVQWSRFIGVIIFIWGFFKWVFNFFEFNSGVFLIILGAIIVSFSIPFAQSDEYEEYKKKRDEEKRKEREKEENEWGIQTEMYKMEERRKKRELREEAEKRLYGKVKSKRMSFNEEEKEMIFDKFGNKCAICNGKEGLHIHHKDGNSSNNQIGNLIVLCGVCHKKVHMKVR